MSISFYQWTHHYEVWKNEMFKLYFSAAWPSKICATWIFIQSAYKITDNDKGKW